GRARGGGFSRRGGRRDSRRASRLRRLRLRPAVLLPGFWVHIRRGDGRAEVLAESPGTGHSRDAGEFVGPAGKRPNDCPSHRKTFPVHYVICRTAAIRPSGEPWPSPLGMAWRSEWASPSRATRRASPPQDPLLPYPGRSTAGRAKSKFAAWSNLWSATPARHAWRPFRLTASPPPP